MVRIREYSCSKRLLFQSVSVKSSKQSNGQDPHPDFHVASCSIASSTPIKNILSSRWSWVSGFPSRTCSICFTLTGYDLQKLFTAKKNWINYFSSFHLFPSLQQSDAHFSTTFFAANKLKIPMKHTASWSFSSRFFSEEEKAIGLLNKKVTLELTGEKGPKPTVHWRVLALTSTTVFLSTTSAQDCIFSPFKLSLQGTI